jgi:hypothetical protein
LSGDENITGAEKLASIFGEWPYLHDAEVVSFAVERAFPLKPDWTMARLVVNIRRTAMEYSDDIHYEYVLKKNVLATFVFPGVCELEISGWNHQNVIDSLVVTVDEERKTGRLKVEIETIWGFGGSFFCSAAELESVKDLAIP